MAADTRSVHTDALATLGFIHTEQQYRDAIHLAVEPVEAGQLLTPGHHIGLGPDGKAYIAGSRIVTAETQPNGVVVEALGIVDPFLTVMIDPGEHFWLVVYPRQISSLRHVWEHPKFSKSGETDHPAEQAASLDPAREQEMRVLLGDPIAQAYQRIQAYANELSDICDDGEGEITAEDLIETAMTNLDLDGKDTWGKDYIMRGGALEGVLTDSEFWNDLAIYKGIEIPYDKRESFFSCAC